MGLSIPSNTQSAKAVPTPYGETLQAKISSFLDQVNKYMIS